MPMSQPVALTACALMVPEVTTNAAVSPVEPAAVQPTAPADWVNSVVAAVPPTANALAPSAVTPNRRERALFFGFMALSLSQRSINSAGSPGCWGEKRALLGPWTAGRWLRWAD